MLNITGPIQTSQPPVQERIDQFLKVNQRIAGEIINVSNEQVILAVNGVQIVAKMTSAEQLASLMEKRYAYFIVKDINENQITLQLAMPTPAAVSQKPVLSGSIGHVLLEQMGMSVDEGNLIIVQAALNRGLKITPELVNEIKQVLENTPNWGTNEARLAVAIKSAGLPLTEGSLELAQNAIKDINKNFVSIYSQLSQALSRPGASQSQYQMIRAALAELQNVLVQGENSIENIEKNLQNSVKGIGVSIEKEISKLLEPETRRTQLSTINNTLFTLANLRHELRSAGMGQLGAAIDSFLQGMRWMHFVNAEPEQPLAKGHWTQVDLPITFGYSPINPQKADNVHNLQIRVAHEFDEESGNRINPDYTRLVIQVDLEDDETIKVDLSIVSRMIGAEITASNEEICLKASEELDDFKSGLTNIGYTLKTSRVELGNTNLEMDINETGKSLPSISSVDLGV